MAELAKIGEFYDGEDWESYIERLEQYCIVNDIEETKKKRALLLSAVGAKTYEIPAKPVEKTFEEIKDAVKKHLSPTPIIIAERFNFCTRKQKPDESVADYLRELKRLAETCDFKAFLDVVLRDVFVIGLEDKTSQCKMLSEADLDITKAFHIAQSREMAVKRVEEIHGEDKVVNFNKVTRKNCFRCGKNNHSPEECFFKDKECYKCNKKGHISLKYPAGYEATRMSQRSTAKPKRENYKYGKKAKKNSSVKYTSELYGEESDENMTPSSDSEPICHIFTSCTNKIRPGIGEYIIGVHIEGAQIDMELDTGSGVSLMSESQYRKTLARKKLKMESSDIQLKSYTGEPLQTIGVCYVTVKYENQMHPSMPLYIVKDDGPSLLGREWLSKFKLNWRKILKVDKICSEVDNTRLKQILEENKEFFDESPEKA